jgi:hypothetical protein
MKVSQASAAPNSLGRWPKEESMHQRHLKFLGVFIVVVLTSCETRTTSISNVKTISIPQNLTAKEAKIAMAVSVSQEGTSNEWTNWQKMTDAALSARFGFLYARQHSRGRWFIERIDPGAVVFGYTQGNYYLRVRMNIETDRIVPVIEDSNGLLQSGDSIHKSAIDWINRLEILIRSSLGEFSAYKENASEAQGSASH